MKEEAREGRNKKKKRKIDRARIRIGNGGGLVWVEVLGTASPFWVRVRVQPPSITGGAWHLGRYIDSPHPRIESNAADKNTNEQNRTLWSMLRLPKFIGEWVTVAGARTPRYNAPQNHGHVAGHVARPTTPIRFPFRQPKTSTTRDRFTVNSWSNLCESDFLPRHTVDTFPFVVFFRVNDRWFNPFTAADPCTGFSMKSALGTGYFYSGCFKIKVSGVLAPVSKRVG